ncbi:S1 family peptidase, partial [Azospirillum halopraeferens]|uniref:S1 family peptidase n=1 Tax=Azospirillum halopraeferens TaxID=34010 RepID=UPI000553C48F
MHDRAVVRVRRDTAVVGAGFLAAPGVVLTCAHVVADALGISRDGTPDDGAAVMVDFPLIAADRTLSARVPVKWWRPFGHDVAVLALAPESAPGVPPAPLAAVPAGAGASFSAFGFPKGFPGGRRERGEVIGPNADGLLEIRPDRADAHVHFVEQGFSGTPAFGKDGVIGMVVATGPKPENRLAYLIPVPWLERGWPPLARPYRGLAPFDAESARWFRGRDDFTTRILDRLAGQAVVVVVGSSGSGKSSVVRAGVAPALTARGWTVATCRIGTQPFRSLARALVDHLYPGQSVGKRTDLTAELAGKLAQPGPAALDHIDGLLESGSRLLVILDQFEELVTRADAAEREAFDGFLCRLIGRGTGSALRVVVTLRSDYTEAIEPLDCARHLLNDARVHLTPMTRQELAQAVRGPADDLGVRFADGIDGDLIGQVTRTPALLPLLQYTLQELWEALDGAVITDAALQACGGLDGVLGRRADAVLQGLDDGGREAARRLFTGHLVNVTETGVGHDTKRTATRAEVGAALWEVARAFAAERVWLLAIQESEPGGATVEIAHEALIRNWDTLRGWLDAVRDLRIWEAAVTRQMAAVNGDSVLETWNPRQVEEARRMLALPDVTPAVRDHAERVLANTEAMDLWSRLRSFDRHEDTLGLLPGLPSRVRDTMIGQLMVSTACAGAFLRSPVETGLGLFGVDPARCRRVAPWVAEPPGVDEPVPLLRARCLAGVLLELPLNPDAIVVALRGTTDRDQCAALGTGLAAVSGRVPDPEGHTAVLLEALRGTRNPYQCAALGAGLAAMFGRVSDPDGHAAALL